MIKSGVFTVFAVLAIALAFTASAASGFNGTWTTMDFAGTVVEITIDDGKATSNVEVAKSGAVTEQDGSALIKWDSGISSVISKHGERYVLNSYAAGTPIEGTPIFTSAIQKK